MTHSYAQLAALSKDQLIQEYDRVAGHTEPGLSFIREELWRRDIKEQNERLERMTKHIRLMTAAITILTIINVIALFAAR